MGLGMPEVILILVVALIIFGPRKLPELGKSLGNAMSQFRRASDDFKRTWEQEVEMDKYRSTYAENNSVSSGQNSSDEYSSSYNPYSGETESTDNRTVQSNDTQQVNAPVTLEPDKVEVAGVSTVASEPKQQHWI